MKKSERITLAIIISVYLLIILGYFGYCYLLYGNLFCDEIDREWELDYRIAYSDSIDFVDESYYNSLYISEDTRYTYELNDENIKVNIAGCESFEKIIEGNINQIEDVSRIIYFDDYYYTISYINSVNKLVKFNIDSIEYNDLSIDGYAYLFYDYKPYILSTKEDMTSVYDFDGNIIGSVDKKYESILSLYIDNDYVLLNNDYSNGYRFDEYNNEYCKFTDYSNKIYSFRKKDGYNAYTFRKCDSFKYIIGKNHFIEFSELHGDLIVIDFIYEPKEKYPTTFFMKGYGLADYDIKSNVLKVTLKKDNNLKTVYMAL